MRVYFPGLRVLAFDNCEFWWGGVVEGRGHFFASPLSRRDAVAKGLAPV